MFPFLFPFLVERGIAYACGDIRATVYKQVLGSRVDLEAVRSATNSIAGYPLRYRSQFGPLLLEQYATDDHAVQIYDEPPSLAVVELCSRSRRWPKEFSALDAALTKEFGLARLFTVPSPHRDMDAFLLDVRKEFADWM